jgi:hypothetical protein
LTLVNFVKIHKGCFALSNLAETMQGGETQQKHTIKFGF